MSVFSCLFGEFLLILLYRHTLDISVQFSSGAQLCRLFLNEKAARQASLSITTTGVYSNSFPSSHPRIRMSQLFAWGGQSIGVSALTSVFQMSTQDWSPLGCTGLISLQFKGLSRIFSNTTVQKHQFFGAQLSSQSNSHIHTWPLEKP